MSDDNEQVATSPEGEGTPEASPAPTGTSQPDELSLARKRQAGAEAARQEAVSKAKELEKELAKYRTAAQTDSEKDMTELARLTARLEQAEQRAAEADKRADARILDARFPNARKELPEVTDEVRLAKFEAILAEGEAGTPTPMQHSETRSSATTAPVAAKPETAADVRARLEAMPMPAGWSAG